MTVELDHILVPARDKIAAARQLAALLDVPWAETGVGPFAPVFINDGLTFDFDQHDQPFPVQHYCFRVSDTEFDAIFARIKKAGLAYRSGPHGPMDMQVGTAYGGRNVYWDQPEGHIWEMLTVSYARAP